MNNADQAQRSLADMLIKSLQKNKDTVKEEKLESNRVGPIRACSPSQIGCIEALGNRIPTAGDSVPGNAGDCLPKIPVSPTRRLFLSS